MKRLTTLLMTLMLMSTMLWADQTITVSANSSDISEGLDLKVVAKLFAEAKNLEEFEMMLNNPDSAFCNLDLNGDGQVDYLRVIETGEGNKRLIVLQAVLAKDIYQDVASIYVEKDANNQVSVQVIGDEYVYGANYIIEPVYVYRPLIYDWMWSDAWYAWYSPWYWGYYPAWWYAHHCWAHDWYWHHCYAYHHHHHWCSFRTGHHVHSGYHELRPTVTRRDYAVTNPGNSFSSRNTTMTNARDIRSTSTVRTTRTLAANDAAVRAANTNTSVSRSTNTGTATKATSNTTLTRSTGTATRSTNTVTRSTNTVTRSTNTVTRSTGTATRSTGTSTKSSGTLTRSTGSSTRSTGSSTRSTSSVSRTTNSRAGSSYSGSTHSTSTYSGSSRSSSGSSSSSVRSGSVSSGSGSRSSGGTTVRR